MSHPSGINGIDIIARLRASARRPCWHVLSPVTNTPNTGLPNSLPCSLLHHGSPILILTQATRES